MDFGYWLLFSGAARFSHPSVRLHAGFRHIVHVVQSGAVQAGFVQSKHKVRWLLWLLVPPMLIESRFSEPYTTNGRDFAVLLCR